MSKAIPRRSYQTGTVLMRTDGVPYVKTDEGWKAEHRRKLELSLGRDLEPGEKVFHLDNTLKGENGYNDKNNLVMIKCRTTKWKKLSHSRILWEPPKGKKLREYVKN